MTLTVKKRDGLFAKVGLQLVTHQGAMMAGEAAMGLWTFLTLYSRLHELDGFVPQQIAERGWGGGLRANRNLLKRLSSPSVNLVSSSSHPLLGPGFIVLKYEEFNDTKADVADRRARTNARVQQFRNGDVTRYKGVTRDVTSGVTNAFVPVSVSISDVVVSSDPDPDLPPAPGSEPRKLTNDERYMGAYVRGIEAGKRGPYEPPGTLADQGMLNRALARFGRAGDGKALRGEALLGWIEDAASDFATDVVRKTREDPQQIEFFSGLACKGFVRWLNMQELGAEARRVG